ncbi:MAG: hypothetical protein WCM76_04785 [Bacteroidota bacterium]
MDIIGVMLINIIVAVDAVNTGEAANTPMYIPVSDLYPIYPIA